MDTETLRSDRMPLYLQVAEALRQRIARGLLAEGARLPAMERLAKEFSVARVTVRQAVALLQEEGWLEARRGRGTVVLPRPAAARPLRVETTLAALVEVYRGDHPALETVEEFDGPLPANADGLGEPAERYRILHRVHQRNGRPYCVIALHIAGDVFDAHAERFRSEVALPVLMEDAHLEVARAWQVLTIGRCGMEAAGRLGLPIGAPTAEVRRVIVEPSGRVAYLADVTYAGDIVRIEMDLLSGL